MATTGMIPQNKGKDLHKIAPSKVPDGPFYCSKKYDGFYIQIKYVPHLGVQMWTSGGKKFYIYELGDYIVQTFNTGFHIECEYSYDSEGFLGDRGKSAILTTYRTNFAKGIITHGSPDKDIIRVLDVIDAPGDFEARLDFMVKMFSGEPWFKLPHFYKVDMLAAQKLANHWVTQGYEGAMLKKPTHNYVIGPRVSRHNDIIKLKPRKTADLLCIGWQPGEQHGKYENAIGSLHLRDSKGIECFAGSGLSDDERYVDGEEYIGKVIEIQYERIEDTYIQPVIKAIRYDKSIEEID